MEEDERRRGQERRLFGGADGHRLGDQLPHQDMQVGDQGIGQHKGGGVRHHRARDAEPVHDGLDQFHHRRLGQEAQPDAGKGDADLADRQVFVQPALDFLHQPGPDVAGIRQSLDLGRPHLDHGKLGQHEKGVEQQENKSQQDVKGGQHGKRIV